MKKIVYLLIFIAVFYSCKHNVAELDINVSKEDLPDISVNQLESDYNASKKLKAKILAPVANNYTQAADHLQEINENFSYGLLADDALFMLAELFNYHLDEKEKAKELYRLMLTRYPGSVFIEESREKFRELRESYPDDLNNQEDFIFQDTIPDEIN